MREQAAIDLRRSKLVAAPRLFFRPDYGESQRRQELARMFRQGRKAWLACADAEERAALALSMGTLAVYAGRAGIIKPMSQIKLCEWVSTWA